MGVTPLAMEERVGDNLNFPKKSIAEECDQPKNSLASSQNDKYQR